MYATLKTAASASVLAPLQRKGAGPISKTDAAKPHDKVVPVKAFSDDVKRKVALRKMMMKMKKPATLGHLDQSLKHVKRDMADLKQMHKEADVNEQPPNGLQWQKEDVNYRYQSSADKTCGTCEHFIAPHTCEIVAGLIRPVDVCDKFEPLEHVGVVGGPIPSRLVVTGDNFGEADQVDPSTPTGKVLREKPLVTRARLVAGFFGPNDDDDEDDDDDDMDNFEGVGPDELECECETAWNFARKDPKFRGAIKLALGEVSPPGWSGTVMAMKKHKSITNPWALAWYMKGKGASPHYKPEKKTSEGGPGSGPSGGHLSSLHIDRIKSLGKVQQRKAAYAMRKQSEEGGPGSGRKPGGKKIFAKDQPESPEDKQVAMFSRRETPGQRAARIRGKTVDPHQAKAIQRALMVVRATLASEGVMGTIDKGNLPEEQPDHQQYRSPGLSHGRRGGA
jgi:hypothetical protein